MTIEFRSASFAAGGVDAFAAAVDEQLPFLSGDVGIAPHFDVRRDVGEFLWNDDPDLIHGALKFEITEMKAFR